MTTARRARDYAQVKPENRKIGRVFIAGMSISQNHIFSSYFTFSNPFSKNLIHSLPMIIKAELTQKTPIASYFHMFRYFKLLFKLLNEKMHDRKK
jgi:hypothetical protein